jgi:hypothetical protein
MRRLSCSSLDRPVYTLPWPFRLLQPRSFRYRLYDDDMVVEESRFERRQINSAISKLLEDVSADKEIIIMWEE